MVVVEDDFCADHILMYVLPVADQRQDDEVMERPLQLERKSTEKKAGTVRTYGLGLRQGMC